MDVHLRKTLQGLAPADAQAEEELRKVRAGEDVKVKITRARNPRSVRHHRLYWALVHKVFDNLPDDERESWATARDLERYIRLLAGHFDTKFIRLSDGELYRWADPRSISFASMDQNEFNEFFDRAIKGICVRLLSVLPEELEAEVLEMIGVAA